MPRIFGKLPHGFLQPSLGPLDSSRCPPTPQNDEAGEESIRNQEKSQKARFYPGNVREVAEGLPVLVRLPSRAFFQYYESHRP